MKHKSYQKTPEFCLEIRPVGNYCPNKCSFCYQERSSSGSPQTMPVEMPIVLLDKLKNLFVKNKAKKLKIVFHGGEPSFDGGVWVSKAARKICAWHSKYFSQMQVTFLCHVSGFVELNKKLFIDNNIHISISRHGSYQVLNSNGLKPQEIINLDKNLQQFANINLLNKQNIVVKNDSIKNLNEIIKIISESKITTKLIPQFCKLRNNNKLTKESVPTNSEIIEFYKNLINESDKKGLSLSNVEPFNRFANYLFDAENTSGCRFSSACPFSSPPIWSLALNNDGNIYPCNRFAGIMNHHLSNIDSKGLIEDAQNKLKDLSKYYGYRKENMVFQCEKCLVRAARACPGTGGCPFFAFLYETTLDKIGSCIDPHCEIDLNLFKLLYSIDQE